MGPMVLTFPEERDVFLKESNMKMYGVTSYFLGKTMPEFIFLVIFPFLFSLIVYFPCNMNIRNARYFFEFVLVTLC